MPRARPQANGLHTGSPLGSRRRAGVASSNRIVLSSGCDLLTLFGLAITHTDRLGDLWSGTRQVIQGNPVPVAAIVSIGFLSYVSSQLVKWVAGFREPTLRAIDRFFYGIQLGS